MKCINCGREVKVEYDQANNAWESACHACKKHAQYNMRVKSVQRSGVRLFRPDRYCSVTEVGVGNNLALFLNSELIISLDESDGNEMIEFFNRMEENIVRISGVNELTTISLKPYKDWDWSDVTQRLIDSHDLPAMWNGGDCFQVDIQSLKQDGTFCRYGEWDVTVHPDTMQCSFTSDEGSWDCNIEPESLVYGGIQYIRPKAMASLNLVRINNDFALLLDGEFVAVMDCDASNDVAAAFMAASHRIASATGLEIKEIEQEYFDDWDWDSVIVKLSHAGKAPLPMTKEVKNSVY